MVQRVTAWHSVSQHGTAWHSVSQRGTDTNGIVMVLRGIPTPLAGIQLNPQRAGRPQEQGVRVLLRPPRPGPRA